MGSVPVDRCKVPRALWSAIEYLGLQPTAVLRQARLPVTLNLSAQSIVTTAQFFAIWKALEALTGDPGFGIKLVEATDAAGHQPLFLAACYASNYRDGISRIARFKRVASPERFCMEDMDGEVSISRQWFHAIEPEPSLAVVVNFASLVALGRRGTGQHITPVRIDFAGPGSASKLQRDYFGCPINYGKSCSKLVLSSTDLKRPFPAQNLEILDILTPALRNSLADFGPNSTICEQVKVVLKRRLASGRPELADVARDLGMSERTLQRRITRDGTTYRNLLMEARQELGRQLVSNPSIQIDEVALLLGYQDTSSFYRAFSQWEGMTPSYWRTLNGGRTNASS